MSTVTELYKPARKHFETRHFIQKGIDDTHQADIYSFYRPKGKIEDASYNLRTKSTPIDNEYKKLLRANDRYQYILVLEDTFSKFVWIQILKTKSGIEVANAFLFIFDRINKSNHHIPKKLHVDRGKEFYNKDVKKVLDEYNIEMYSTGTKNKASMVERFNRTLGEKLKVHLYKNKRWIDVVFEIVDEYNNTYHHTIKMKPKDVTKDNEALLLSTIYNYRLTTKKPKFKIGDRVRLSKNVDAFKNKFKTNWTKEIFIISEVLRSNVIYYKVVDESGKEIKEGIYEEELQLTAS